MSLQSNQKLAFGQQSTSKKHVTPKSSELEPVIWSCDTGQQIPCFDRCQLTMTWISNIKEVHYKTRLRVEYCRHRRCAYAPTNNTASHDNHDKINAWVSCTFLYRYGAPRNSVIEKVKI